MKPLGVSPRVSVVVPVYNAEPYIVDALDSVLAQSYGDLELLVVDDGSTDESAEKVAALRDPRIRMMRQPNSGRPAVPRNRALAQARGEYVAFLDADDLWVDGKLQRQVAVLDARPETALVYGWAEAFGPGGTLGYRGPKRVVHGTQVFEQLLLEQCFIPISTVLVRRSVLDALGGFDEAPELRGVEDYDLVLRVAQQHACVFMPEVLLRYRVHGANLSADGLALVEGVRTVVRRAIERWDVQPELAANALHALALEQFKAAMQGKRSVEVAREAVRLALEQRPNDRRTHQLLRALDAGLYGPMSAVYRRRAPLVRLRDRANRWLALQGWGLRH